MTKQLNVNNIATSYFLNFRCGSQIGKHWVMSTTGVK